MVAQHRADAGLPKGTRQKQAPSWDVSDGDKAALAACRFARKRPGCTIGERDRVLGFWGATAGVQRLPLKWGTAFWSYRNLFLPFVVAVSTRRSATWDVAHGDRPLLAAGERRQPRVHDVGARQGPDAGVQRFPLRAQHRGHRGVWNARREAALHESPAVVVLDPAQPLQFRVM